MLSQSIKEVIANSSAIRAMFEEGRRMAQIHGADRVYDFSLGNPNVAPPEEVRRAILEIAGNEDPVFLHGYMVNAGYPDSRKAIAESINRRFGVDFDENSIIMTVGAAGAMNVAFKTLLDPGDEVVVFAPFFGEYRWYVRNFGGELVIVPNASEDFQPDLAGLEKALSPRTKAVIINSPNNPSGAVYPAKTLEALGGILEGWRKKTGNTVYLISDEPYREIAYDGADVPYVTKFYANTFVAYSYSKALSLPGERIGYLAVPREMDGYGEIWPALATANRILGFVNSPSLFQRVAAVCADAAVDTAFYRENRDILYNSLTEMGYECFKPQGAFYLFPKSPLADDVAFCEAAKKFRLLIVPGRSFGAPGYFRISYCVKRETVLNSLESFAEAIKSV
ncbi:MAG: pyridoxal phosphate-dependent aminotransferase [Firmicutes bacterium]|nr:pyridoxal phosphate-dependent aminotransferase [Bacillota bacterium]